MAGEETERFDDCRFRLRVGPKRTDLVEFENWLVTDGQKGKPSDELLEMWVITQAVIAFKGAYTIESLYQLLDKGGAPAHRLRFALSLLSSKNKIDDIRYKRG